MSCTVVAVPYALMWVVGAIASAAATAAANNQQDNKSLQEFTSIYNEAENCSEDHVITEKHFIEKTFETPFMETIIESFSGRLAYLKADGAFIPS